MKWDLDSDRPIFTQIIETIQKNIVSGVLQPGEKLPSVRCLAGEASVNPNTVQKSYSELERMGLVSSQRTSGKFITEDIEMIERTKKEMARTIVDDFLKNMSQLGFTEEQALSLARIADKEGKDE
jgi:DNA-binding transcriptional regulator YhcF (GntR family)